ncbi:hypothetical protein OAK24_01920 [Flavobacteriales bacterium]|nr:hypothetical protein [Flavobacteriales bacterium]
MRFLFTLFLTIIILSTFAQENKQSSFSFGYTHQLPIGDLAERFEDNSSIGFSFMQEKESNLFYGIEANYLFSNNVKDNAILKNITTSNGAIIGADGTYSDINLSQRGFDAYIFAGYAYHPKKTNLSGFYLSGGIGFLQHQIFIDTKNQTIPQLNNEMKKGYDRLTNGISSNWQATYRYYDKSGKFQIYLGLNMVLAYTKIQRKYLFDKMEYTPNTKSWDKLAGVKIGIIIPINRKNEEEFHYY